MFTGIVEEMGVIERIEPRGEGRRVWITAQRVLEDAFLGASLAVDGCCLTAVELQPRGFAVDAVPETLSRTTLGERVAGDPVHLERPVRSDGRMGGHFVQGHVDGVGTVLAVKDEPPGRRITFRVPDSLRRFVAEKGSIAIDGVSLTVAACSGDSLEVAYVPYTLEVTAAGRYAAGRRVNLEVDLVARYLARLLAESGVAGDS